MATRLGKQKILVDAYRADGSPALAIWCDWSVYQRKDGSFFSNIPPYGRTNVTARDGGGFYLKLVGKKPVAV